MAETQKKQSKKHTVKDQKIKEIEEGVLRAALPERVDHALKGEEGLARYDAFRAYLQEVRGFPTLSQEEEYSLAVRYREQGDTKAAYRLITSNLRLVVSIALKFYGTIHNVMDLIQEGNIGLMQAVKQFDPYRGAKLSSYAVWWIRAYILRYVINNAKTVKVGTTETQRKLFFRLNKERERLLKEGLNPGARMLAERLDVKEQDVQEMTARLMSPDLSLDYAYGEESNQTLADKIGVEDAIVERIAEDEIRVKRLEKLEELKEKLKGELKPKERVIYERRIFAQNPATLQELGEELGISRERVRQLEAGIIKRLKEGLAQDQQVV